MLTLEQYLHTSFEYDCDYVDGEVIERSLPQLNHAIVQGNVLYFFRPFRASLKALPGLRLRVKATRVRVADVAVFQGKPQEQVPSQPPYIVIEILSPDDRFSRIQPRLDDYSAFGVPNIWVLDPEERRGYEWSGGGRRQTAGGILRTSDGGVEMPLSEVFADL